MVLSVMTKPGRKTTALQWTGTQAVVSIKAPAKEGKANRELVQTLAEFFRLRQDQIQIKTGHAGRHKRVLIDLDRDQALEMLEKSGKAA